MARKEVILKILKASRAGAVDDLTRIKLECSRVSDIDKEYALSGRTYRQILNKWEKTFSDIDDAITWVNTL